MPPVIRKRGRPKGHLLTTIGLPSKKTKYASKPCSFERLGCRERERGKEECCELSMHVLYFIFITCKIEYYFMFIASDAGMVCIIGCSREVLRW